MSTSLADLSSLMPVASATFSTDGGDVGYADTAGNSVVMPSSVAQEIGSYTGSPTFVGTQGGGSGWQTYFSDATKLLGMFQGYSIAQQQVNRGMAPTALSQSGTLAGVANVSAANSSLARSLGSSATLLVFLGIVVLLVLLVKK